MTQFVQTGAGGLSPFSNLEQYKYDVGPPKLQRLRLFIHGKVGCGKTSFAASFPKTAILEFERKIIDPPVVGEGTQAFYADTPTKWLEIIDTLVAMKMDGDNTFDTVALDTASCFSQIMRTKLSYTYAQAGKLKKSLSQDIVDYKERGAGYALLAKATCDQVEKLFAAGYGWIALCHTRNTAEDSDKTPRSALSPSIADYFFGQADGSAFLSNDEELTDTGGKWERAKIHKLSFLPFSSDLPARSPLLQMPETITLGRNAYTSFKEEYDKASTTPNQEAQP